MNIGLITFHGSHNYGSVLQAYATQKLLEEKGDHCEIINFRMKSQLDYYSLYTAKYGLLTLGQEILMLPEHRERKRRSDKFEHFITKRFSLSGRALHTYKDLKEVSTKYDLYVTGSDQIWNPFLTGGVAGAYYCSFVKERNRKFAYAPSFGTDKISPRHKKKMESYIKELSAISVREKDSIQYMKEHIGREAVQLIDPVFLVSAAEWKKEAVKIDGIPEKYILLYIMQRDETVYSYAKKLKEQFHLPIIEISRYGYQPSFVDISLINIGPQEFLGLFLHATYVVSNSYHGLIFSIVFDKKLCLVPSKRFRSRINNLLALLDRKEHTLDEDDLLISFSDPTLRGCILKEREKSIHYLQENIWS